MVLSTLMEGEYMLQPSTYRVTGNNNATLVTLEELKDHLNLFAEDVYDDYLTYLRSKVI